VRSGYGKPNLIRDMIKFNKPVMGCFYAKRKAEAEVVGTADAHTIADVQHGFVKATGIGCGVMMISRDVITKCWRKSRTSATASRRCWPAACPT
jgi:hypothetical protein